MVTIVLQVFQSFPAMTGKYTALLQCMSDLRTRYIHGCVIWQCNDRLNYAVFELQYS